MAHATTLKTEQVETPPSNKEGGVPAIAVVYRKGNETPRGAWFPGDDPEAVIAGAAEMSRGRRTDSVRLRHLGQQPVVRLAQDRQRVVEAQEKRRIRHPHVRSLRLRAGLESRPSLKKMSPTQRALEGLSKNEGGRA